MKSDIFTIGAVVLGLSLFVVGLYTPSLAGFVFMISGGVILTLVPQRP